MNTLILVNGDLPESDFLLQIVPRFESVIATDGAVHSLSRALKISAICGDFDSISSFEAARVFPEAQIVETPDQDRSDLEKAIYFALDRGATSITLVGALGGRIDHSLVSISVLIKYHHTVPIALIDSESELNVFSPGCARAGALDVSVNLHSTISLVSLSPQSLVSISGVRWPLSDRLLEAGSGGVSNIATSDHISFRITQGIVALTRPFAIDDGR